MNKIKLLIIIIILLLKTGNVLSVESIFNVNNIELDGKFYSNKQKSINKGFIDGFDKLIKRIALKRDYNKALSTNLKEVRNLVSYYQLIEPASRFLNKNTYLNLYFDKEKINKYFYKKNISYSDLLSIEAVILPVHITDKNFFVYNDNYFYDNWTTKNNIDSIVEYIFPVDSLEILSIINNKKNNLDEIDIKKLFADYNSNNLIFISIYTSKNKNRVFLKSLISGKEIVKNYEFTSNEHNDFKEYIILELKDEIEDLIKSENTLDLTVPSFLNINLNLKNKNNLFKTQNILKKIDLIDYFHVKEFNNTNAVINIKFYGKINKIREKLLQNNLNLYQADSQWNISIEK